MPDDLSYVQKGDPVKPRASGWNTLMEVGRNFRANKREMGVDASGNVRTHNGTILVQNVSGGDVDRFSVMGVDSILFSNADNADTFQNEPCLTVTTPATAHRGKFVILLDGAKDDVVVRAMVSGVCPVQVNVVDADHQFADVTNADATKLTSCSSGAARILYKDSGTGTKWAIVRLGGGGGSGLFPVTVSQTGGSAGTDAAKCSFTYTATDLDGNQLGTVMSPTWARPALGAMVAATKGVGYYDAAGAFVLYQVDEVPDVVSCEAS